MNVGRLVISILFLTVLGCAAETYAQTVPVQTPADIPWKYLSGDDVWIRRLDEHGVAATLTLYKRGSELEYGITVPCLTPQQTASYTWKHGDSIGRSKTGCDGMATVIETEGWIEAFEPIPEKIRPAEVFVEPGQWPPQFIA